MFSFVALLKFAKKLDKWMSGKNQAKSSYDAIRIDCTTVQWLWIVEKKATQNVRSIPYTKKSHKFEKKLNTMIDLEDILSIGNETANELTKSDSEKSLNRVGIGIASNSIQIANDEVLSLLKEIRCRNRVSVPNMTSKNTARPSRSNSMLWMVECQLIHHPSTHWK